MDRERVVNVRVSEAGLAEFDRVCAERGVRRSGGIRAAMKVWAEGPAGSVARSALIPREVALQIAREVQQAMGPMPDVRELRWWREFADRTWLDGDPERHVAAGTDLAGWHFTVISVPDDNRNIA